jgi:S1-C subfamily serine protease
MDIRSGSADERSDRLAAVRALRSDLARLRNEVTSLSAQNAVLARRLGATEQRARISAAGIAPLARRVLASVFTIDTDYGSGSGFAAWSSGGSTFVITAAHVVEGASSVLVRRKLQRWRGRVVRTDSTNDLALIRVDGQIGRPLWQLPKPELTPVPGEELLLVGSPYGLEGTVTTGITSRVTYNRIQTDAAANPGNSGGPAVNGKGDVVGVLVAGGGENLNFAIPIQRACVTLRRCPA